MMVNFNTAIYIKGPRPGVESPRLAGHLVESHTIIAKNYLQSWFFFDLSLIVLDIVNMSTGVVGAGSLLEDGIQHVSA